MADGVAKREAAKLKGFTDFVAAAGVGGVITTVGIPQGVPSHSLAQYQTDVANWQKILEYWYTKADDARLWVTGCLSGPALGDTLLGLHTNPLGASYTSTGQNITRAMSPGGVNVVESHPAQASTVLRGVTVSGLESGVDSTFSNVSRGALNDGTSHAYYLPTLADIAYLASRNVQLVRVPVVWERLQPTLLAPLDPTYLALLSRVIDACAQNAMQVVIDLHNLGRYAYDLGGGTRRVLHLRVPPGLDTIARSDGEGRLGGEYLRDVWTRLAAQYNPTAAVVGYDLQYAPTGLGGDSVAAFGVSGTSSSTDRQQAKTNGVTHVLVQAIWSQLQPGGAGTALDPTALATMQAAIADANARNMGVLLECAVQYPPTWVLSSVPKFVKQDGATWTGTGSPDPNANGDNVRDWIWTQTGRTYVADFCTKVVQAIDQSKVDAIKLGGGVYGQLRFPPVSNPQPLIDPPGGFEYWGYGAAAQRGVDLASGMAQCPASICAPFVPFTSGNASSDDTAWTNWYLESLKTFLLWQIQTYKQAGFGGLLYVQHPAFGIRSNWAVSSAGYHQAIAQGQDWDRFLAAYQNDRQVWPYSTWLDAIDVVTPVVNDSDKAAWRKLYDVASARGKTALIWGENSGGQSNADLNRIFATGAIAYGYRGLVWQSHASLTAGGGAASYVTYQTTINALNAGLFSGTTRYDWETTSPTATQGWLGETTATVTRDTTTYDSGIASLKISQAIPGGASGYYYVRANDNSTLAGGAMAGNTLQFRARLAAGTRGTWYIRAEWQDQSFVWHNNGDVPITAGTWTTVSITFPAGITTPKAFGVQFTTDDISPAASTTVTLNLDAYAQGTTVVVKTIPSTLTWEVLTQQLVTAIRGTGSTKTLFVPGYGATLTSWPHSAGWINDPLNAYRYATNQFFDPDGSGTYDPVASTYAATLTAAHTAGYPDDGVTTTPAITAVSSGTPGTADATITYTTDASADTRLLYRSSNQAAWFGTTVRSDLAGVTAHTVPLTGLVPGTAYVFEIRAADQYGNLATSQSSFSTQAEAGTAPGENLLGNSGFEFDTLSSGLADGYAVTGTPVTNRVGPLGTNGSYAQRLIGTLGTTVDLHLSAPVPITGGRQYTFSALTIVDALSSVSATCSMALEWYAAGTLLATNTTTIALVDPTPVRRTLTATSPVGAATVVVRYTLAGGGTVRLDDTMLEQAPNASVTWLDNEADAIVKSVLTNAQASGAAGAIPWGFAAPQNLQIRPDEAGYAALGLAAAYRRTGVIAYRDAVWAWLSWYAAHQEVNGTCWDWTAATGTLVREVVSPPPSPSLLQSASGGTLSAATYAYKVTALNTAGGETTANASTTTIVASGTTTSITVSWTAQPNAYGYRVYGRTSGSEQLLVEINDPTNTTTTWVDTGANAPGGTTPPGTNTCYSRNNTDSYAALFLLVAWAAYTVDPTGAKITPLAAAIAGAVSAIELTQQPDGLTWRKPEDPTKLLQNQCEALAGLWAANRLANGPLATPALAARTLTDASAMQTGITALWNPDTPLAPAYDTTVSGSGMHTVTTWTTLSAALAQTWPALYGVADDARMALLVAQLDTAQPSWDQPALTGRYDPLPGIGFTAANNRARGLSSSWNVLSYALTRSPARSWPYNLKTAGQTLLVRLGAGDLLRVLGVGRASTALPQITSVDPPRFQEGQGPVTITVYGINFLPSTVVTWNGSPRTTSYVSSTVLQATLTAADLVARGSGVLWVQ